MPTDTVSRLYKPLVSTHEIGIRIGLNVGKLSRDGESLCTRVDQGKQTYDKGPATSAARRTISAMSLNERGRLPRV